MPFEPDLLAGLRDVILPPFPGFWPPAPGWWLSGLLVLIVTGALKYWMNSIAANRPKKSVIRLVNEIAALEPREAVSELSILMRRVAVTKFPRASVASLTGQDWLEFLDRSSGTNLFTQGPGRVLASAPYMRAGLDEIGPVAALCRDWVDRVM